MRHVIIIGAGGHGREILDILSTLPEFAFNGFIDDDASLHGVSVSGAAVLGGLASLREHGDAELVIAMGSPTVARRVVDQITGRRFATIVSPHAVVSERAALANGIAVFPNAVIGPDCEIGDHCFVNVGATVSHDCTLERHVNVNPGAHLAGNVYCEEGVYVGMGANILPGRRIGAGSVIGAGAVVIHDIPAGATAVGVPARIVRRV